MMHFNSHPPIYHNNPYSHRNLHHRHRHPPRTQYSAHAQETHQNYYHPYPFHYPQPNQTYFHPPLPLYLLYNDLHTHYPDQPSYDFRNLYVQSGNFIGNLAQESSDQPPPPPRRSSSIMDTTALLRHILRNQDDGTSVLDAVEVELGDIRMRFSANEDGTFAMIEGRFIGLDGYNDDNDSRSGLSEETISQHLKTRIYQTPCDHSGGGEEGEGFEICVVCQSEYENGETLGTLEECRHEYHSDCIRKWLRTKNNCPVCKRTAIPQQSINNEEESELLGC